MSESILILIALVLMIGAVIVSLVPLVPGPALVWLIALAFGIVNDFDRLPVLVMLVLTILMLIGSTDDFWMPVLGMRVQGGSCLGAIGALVGGLAGTFIIPIPLLGTLLGAIAGALVLEFLRIGDLRKAMSSGRLAAQTVLLGLLVEFGIGIAMIVVFVLSVFLTG